MSWDIACWKCGEEYDTRRACCPICSSPVKRQAKRSPARVSLQRRVGRSASGGKPKAVARPVGRKKAVQDGGKREAAFYRKLLEQIADGPRNTMDRRIAESGLIFWDSMQAKAVLRQKPSHPDAASRRRQRAIPANAELSGTKERR